MLTDRLGRLLNLCPNTRVLDVAAGHGTSAVYLAERFGCQVTAVDYGAQRIVEGLVLISSKAPSCIAALTPGRTAPDPCTSADPADRAEILAPPAVGRFDDDARLGCLLQQSQRIFHNDTLLIHIPGNAKGLAIGILHHQRARRLDALRLLPIDVDHHRTDPVLFKDPRYQPT